MPCNVCSGSTCFIPTSGYEVFRSSKMGQYYQYYGVLCLTGLLDVILGLDGLNATQGPSNIMFFFFFFASGSLLALTFDGQ